MMTKLTDMLKKCSTVKEKIELLQSLPGVEAALHTYPTICNVQKPEEQLVLLSMIAIGQAEHIFPDICAQKRTKLIEQLSRVEQCYATIGGIVGYHEQAIALLQNGAQRERNVVYHSPKGTNISEDTPEVREAMLDGITHLPQLAEMYPLGGAADRLNLYDEPTQLPLPAAKLPFLGKSLLEGLIADLQSREYLYYKIFGSQITTPVAIMTSEEKNNDTLMRAMCDEMGWFGRPKESFYLFRQPLVPTLNSEGDWCLQNPGELLLKPGGHGMIWKVAQEEGVIDWLLALGRKKGIIRQVNNPIANTDYGILAFSGIGFAQDKAFGFASCPRLCKSAEGVNILLEEPTTTGHQYTLTNIEYCDFVKFGILDEPESEANLYSKFPSNTNLLFVDLAMVKEAVKRCPFPGTVINPKQVAYFGKKGTTKGDVFRLESTMQNLADGFHETFETPQTASHLLPSKIYLTYNHRNKTICTLKKPFVPGSSSLETPEECWMTILQNNRDLLVEHCQFDIPFLEPLTDTLQSGPSAIFLFHPSLGPLYSVIRQKLRKGSFQPGSELQLQIAEVDIEHLHLDGTLLVQAEQLMGHTHDHLLQYSESCGRLVLKNVSVENQGIDSNAQNIYWKNEITRKGLCHILLRGMSEFYAEHVTLKGDLFIEVPDRVRCIARPSDTGVEFIFENIETPSWYWEYSVEPCKQIQLHKQGTTFVTPQPQKQDICETIQKNHKLSY